MTVKVQTSYNNFSRGQVDHDMMGRYDLPIYNTGADWVQNFITNFKGNAIFRSGFENMVSLEDCELIEFKFNDTQAYICVFTAGHIRFLAYDTNGNFGWVLNGGVPLDIANPYTLAQCKEVDYAQNSDTMYVVHNQLAPYKLTRIAANNFTFATFARTTDPFSVGNYPACVSFYKGRLYYAATLTKPTTIFGSVAAVYDDFTTTPVDAKSAIIFTLSDIALPIQWLYPGDNSLIAGAADGVVAVNGASVGSAITAASIDANITSAPGASTDYPLAKDGLIFYPDRTSRTLQYFSYDLLSERFTAQDANFISYSITSGGLGKIRWKKDKNDLIFCICADRLLSLNFSQKENIVGWHQHTTNGAFKNQAVIPDNNGDPQLFALTLRFGTYFLERQAKYVEFPNRVQFFSGEGNQDLDEIAYKRYIAELLKGCIFLDNSATVSNLKSNSITYNPGTGVVTATNNVFAIGDVGKHIVYKTSTGYESGRFKITSYTDAKNVVVTVLQAPTTNTWVNWYLSFNSISGLTNYIGQTIGVVTDGGYLTDFLVPGSGTIALGKQVTHAVVGYKYRGLIKSFSLGFQAQGANTQATPKTINKVGLRAIQTAGGKFGTTQYRLENFQELHQGDLNYLPPVPIDGTVFATYPDDYQLDKFFYLVQDDPLPMTATSVMIEGNYVA